MSIKISQTEIVEDRVAGQLEIGTDGKGEVVMNFCGRDWIFDADGLGHITFSPKQARALANLMMKSADEAWRESK